MDIQYDNKNSVLCETKKEQVFLINLGRVHLVRCVSQKYKFSKILSRIDKLGRTAPTKGRRREFQN